MHLTAILLDGLERGKVTPEFVVEMMTDHILFTCEACSEGKGAYETAKGQAPGRLAAEARDPIGRIGRRMGWGKSRLEEEIKVVENDVREIVDLDPETRNEKIGGAYSHYLGPLFGTLLLAEARKRIPAEPGEALELADAAFVSSSRVTRRIPAEPAVQAAALAVRGNAKRALGRLREAETDLEEARRLVYSPKFLDPALPAEVYSYLGSLRKDQGKLDEAARYLHRAGTIYDLLEEPEKAARVLLTLAGVHYRAHAFGAAVQAAEKAVELLPPEAEAWLRAYAHFDLAHHLHARGDLDRAEAELAAHAELLDSAGEKVKQHVVWLRARIAWSRGELRLAERLFKEALGLALELGRGYEGSLLSLELALVYLSQGKTARVKKLAAEALRLLAEEEEVEREIRAAVALVAEAARREELTRGMLERAIAALERARHGRRAPAD